MKFWRSLPLLLAIALFGGVLVGCGGAEEADNSEATEEEVADAEDVDEDDEDEEDEEDEYEPAEFTLVNDTDRPLLEFYVSPPGDEEWGENLIPEDAYVDKRSEVSVVIDDGLPDCSYDILGVLGPSEDGSVGEGELIHSDVEICDGTVYSYTEE